MILTNWQYIEKFILVAISTSMPCSVFKLSFQSIIYHLITSNNCNSVVSPVLLLCSDAPAVALD